LSSRCRCGSFTGRFGKIYQEFSDEAHLFRLTSNGFAPCQQGATTMATPNKITTEPSYTIREFCAEERIAEPTYYKMRAQGLGPKELRYLQVVRITHASRLEWQKRLQSGEFAEAMRRNATRMQAKSHDAASKAIASPSHISNIRRGKSGKTEVDVPPRRKRRGAG
jgi:hypothetical protein